MSQFPIFNSHLDLAPQYWQKILQMDDWALDATCGNGKDSLKLAQLVSGTGKVISLDIQAQAIENSNNLFTKQLTEEQRNKIILLKESHAPFPEIVLTKPIKLIVYNLGYLPGGNKTLTTLSSTTLESVRQALSILLPGGIISLTCYPGHSEGAKELEELKYYLLHLDSSKWNICQHLALNRSKSPSLILIQNKN